jgi:hypothetical protein
MKKDTKSLGWTVLAVMWGFVAYSWYKETKEKKRLEKQNKKV